MKKILILFVLITASIGLHAQQNEIIYVDFEPDLTLHVGGYPPDTIWVDFDNNDMPDILINWGLESPSLWISIYCCNQSANICRAEEGDTITHLTGWENGEAYPHLCETYAIRIEKDGVYYYGWFRTYLNYTPSVIADFCFDKYAFCTIPDYPLVWGQTDIWGIEETLPTTIAHIYPNPAKEQLHFEFSPDMQPALVVFYDLQGRLVHTQHSAFESIDMSRLTAGTYMMRVTMEDGKSYSDKVVKE